MSGVTCYHTFRKKYMSGVTGYHPFRVMSLYSGGTFDKNYNKRYQPIKFSVPASAGKVTHPSDDNHWTRAVPSSVLSVSAALCPFSGGVVRRHHGSRQRRERLRRILRHLAPLLNERRVQQHTHIRFCRWGKVKFLNISSPITSRNLAFFNLSIINLYYIDVRKKWKCLSQIHRAWLDVLFSSLKTNVSNRHFLEILTFQRLTFDIFA